MLIVCCIALTVALVGVAYVVVTSSSAWRRRSIAWRDPKASYVNRAGQAVAQISPSDLPQWLSDHGAFEIVSMANVGPYVVIVYK
jgi:hypothetical protein